MLSTTRSRFVKIKAFVELFGGWPGLMSGGISVPFAAIALIYDGQAKLLFAVLAYITLIIFAGKLIWSLLEHRERLRPKLRSSVEKTYLAAIQPSLDFRCIIQIPVNWFIICSTDILGLLLKQTDTHRFLGAGHCSWKYPAMVRWYGEVIHRKSLSRRHQAPTHSRKASIPMGNFWIYSGCLIKVRLLFVRLTFSGVSVLWLNYLLSMETITFPF